MGILAVIALAIIALVALMLGLSLPAAKQVVRNPVFECGYNFTKVIDRGCTEKIINQTIFMKFKGDCIDTKLDKFPEILKPLIQTCVTIFDKTSDPCGSKPRKTFKKCLKKQFSGNFRKLWKEFANTTNVEFCTDVNDCFEQKFETLPDSPLKVANMEKMTRMKANSKAEAEKDGSDFNIPSAPNAG